MSFVRTKTVKSGFTFFHKVGHVQRRPYVNSLPYLHYGGSDKVEDNFYPPDPKNWTQPYSLGVIQGYEAEASPEARQSYAIAYDRLISKIKGEASAMLAVNAIESRQSYEMIARRAQQLRSAYVSLRSGDLSGFLRTLGFRFSRKSSAWSSGSARVTKRKYDHDLLDLRRGSKSAGALWLEYWFGWKPLLADIHSSVEVLDGLRPTDLRNVFSGSGGARRSHNYSVIVPSSGYVSYDRFTADFRHRIVVTVVVTSRDFGRMNSLGLTNPLTVAWEVVPFSFLVDWFLPVSRYLESHTDSLGISIRNVSSTSRRTCDRDTFTQYVDSSSGRTRVVRNTSKSYHVNRLTPGTLSVPGLMSRRGNGLTSLSRAATAISLLTGTLKHG